MSSPGGNETAPKGRRKKSLSYHILGRRKEHSVSGSPLATPSSLGARLSSTSENSSSIFASIPAELSLSMPDLTVLEKSFHHIDQTDEKKREPRSPKGSNDVSQCMEGSGGTAAKTGQHKETLTFFESLRQMEEKISDSITMVEQRMRSLKLKADLKHQVEDLQLFVSFLKHQKQQYSDSIQKIHRYSPSFDISTQDNDEETSQDDKAPVLMLDSLFLDKSPSDPQLSDLIDHVATFSNDQVVEVLQDLRRQLEDTSQLLFTIQKRESSLSQRWGQMFDNYSHSIDLRNALDISVRQLTRKHQQLSRLQAHLSSTSLLSSTVSIPPLSSSSSSSSSSSLSVPTFSSSSSSSSLFGDVEKESFARRLLKSNDKMEQAQHDLCSSALKDRLDELLDELDERPSGALKPSGCHSQPLAPLGADKLIEENEGNEKEILERLEEGSRSIGLNLLRTLDKETWRESVAEMELMLVNEEREHNVTMKSLQDVAKEYSKEALLGKPHIQHLKTSIIELRQKALALGINLETLTSQ